MKVVIESGLTPNRVRTCAHAIASESNQRCEIDKSAYTNLVRVLKSYDRQIMPVFQFLHKVSVELENSCVPIMIAMHDSFANILLDGQDTGIKIEYRSASEIRVYATI